jgi:hypothetical protein
MQMITRKCRLLLGSLLLTIISEAQAPASKDSLSLGHALVSGQFSGHIRSAFMATENERRLPDAYAWGAGVRAAYISAPWHHLSLGGSVDAVTRIASSDLDYINPTTATAHRYEPGLFDTKSAMKRVWVRPGALFIRYRRQGLQATLGRQGIVTPFVNEQDTRMFATLVEGVYVQDSVNERIQVAGGWFWRVAPRSSVNWYGIGASFGLNGQGVNRDGSKGGHRGNVQTAGLLITSVTVKPVAPLQVSLHSLIVPDVFYAWMGEACYRVPMRSGALVVTGRFLSEGALENGGNADPSKTYFDPSSQVRIFSGRAAWNRHDFEVQLNYTRIGRTGRFTLPREWGVEPLFTYVSRERNEGVGDADAFMLQVHGRLMDHFGWEVAYGQYYLPAPGDASLNKYGLPSYRHARASLRYESMIQRHRLRVEGTVVGKGQLGTVTWPDPYVFNKVNLIQYNLITQLSF